MKYEALRVYQNAFNKIKFPDIKLESKYAIKYCQEMQTKIEQAMEEKKKNNIQETKSLFSEETKKKYYNEEDRGEK